jgi:hypothetical protein
MYYIVTAITAANGDTKRHQAKVLMLILCTFNAYAMDMCRCTQQINIQKDQIPQKCHNKCSTEHAATK